MFNLPKTIVHHFFFCISINIVKREMHWYCKLLLITHCPALTSSSEIAWAVHCVIAHINMKTGSTFVDDVSYQWLWRHFLKQPLEELVVMRWNWKAAGRQQMQCSVSQTVVHVPLVAVSAISDVICNHRWYFSSAFMWDVFWFWHHFGLLFLDQDLLWRYKKAQTFPDAMLCVNSLSFTDLGHYLKVPRKHKP